MNKKYNLKLDLQFRCNNSTMKFNQFDNNTSDFFMRITNGGNLVDIEKALVVLAVIKPSGKVSIQFVEVENGLVYADLKPSMKDEIGIYTAQAMLILEDKRVVTDIISYEVEEDKIFSLLNDTVETTEEFTLLTDMLSRLSTIELNENNREETFNNIKDEFEIIKNNHNELVTTETDNKVTELLDPVVSKANEKINEVDNKIVDIENAISEADSKINNAIAKIPPKSELIGEKGDKGEKGEKGDKGDRGEQGLQGIQGIQGIQGERGLQGVKGDKGDKGEQGIQGLKGDKGDKGDRGEQGVKGDTPSITHLETSINNKIQEVEIRFNALTSSQQQSSEVIDARDGEVSLKARLDRDIEKAKQVYVNVEGSNISTDSSSGYLKDVEILGNTIQSASNLADIRSVGDKVEGQELYEIPVLSCGKNLFDYNKVKVYKGDNYNTNILPQIHPNKFGEYNTNTSAWNDNKIVTDFINVLPNVKYYGFTVNEYEDIRSYLRGVYVYDKDKNYLGNPYWDGGSHGKSYFIFDNNVAYVKLQFSSYATSQNWRFKIFWGIGEMPENSTMMVEQAILRKHYTEYQEDKITILSPTPLEKVGDVADRIICKDGVWGVEKNILNIKFKPHAFYSGTNVNLVRMNVHTLFKFISWESGQFISELEELTNATNWDVLSNVGKFSTITGTNKFDIICSKDIDSIEKFNEDISIIGVALVPTFIPLPHDQQVKLRTFANKTNISFLTEIEGMIKAQVPKSLGATVNTHTTQISNLNKELDRVKKLEESTVSTVTTESDFTTVEATSNGYFEDVKLEGKTLVNLFSESNINPTNMVVNGCSFSRQLTSIKSYGYLEIPLDKLNLFKSNGKYKVIVNITKNTLVEEGGSQKAFELPSYNYGNTAIESSTNGNYSVSFNIGEVGTKECIITMKDFDNPSNPIDRSVLRFSSSFYATSGELEGQILILECKDDLPQDVNFFEGLKSVGDTTDEIVVSSVNPSGNLFDGYLIPNSSINPNTGDVIGNAVFDLSNMITLPNVNKIFTNAEVVGLYDEGSNFISFNTIRNGMLDIPFKAKNVEYEHTLELVITTLINCISL